MLEAVKLGQRPTSEIVDRYGLRDSNIRALVVRYLDERRPGLDYDSFSSTLPGLLVRNFWADIEHHHPDLQTLLLRTHCWPVRTGTPAVRRHITNYAARIKLLCNGITKTTGLSVTRHIRYRRIQPQAAHGCWIISQ